MYRFLTTISEWSINGFYSECHVSGREDIPLDVPLILASTHHNELLDVAFLAVTAPNNQRVSFWARSTAFKNPFSRPFLVSSGALPVNRNPNAVSSSSSSNVSNQDLFFSTIEAMLRGQIVGVFVEGTSYTEPKIMQVMPGAAWAGVEYIQVSAKVGAQGPVIVPVAIVYTDKTKFQSRAWMSYGTPIFVEDYLSPTVATQSDNIAACKEAVKGITAKLREEIHSLTINAPDWETLYAVETARAILFGDEANIHLEHWIRFSKHLVHLFTPSESDSPTKIKAKKTLCEYYSLQRYCHMSEVTLTTVCPRKYTSFPSSRRLFVKCIRFVSMALFHWKSLIFVPLLPVFAPAYLLGWLGGRYLGTPGEPEGIAQHKALVGGAGLGIGLLSSFNLLWRYWLRAEVVSRVEGTVMRTFVMISCAYIFTVAVWRIHKMLVRGAFMRMINAATAIRLLFSQTLALPLNPDELAIFTKPPTLRPNAHIRRLKEEAGESVEYHPVASPPWSTRSRLIRHHLLQARNTALDSLREFMQEAEVDVRVLEDDV